MRRSILVVLAVVIFLAGCSISAPQQQEPQQQFVCPDGVNVVTNLMDCPPYDKEYEECLDMPAASDYGPSRRDECFYNLAFERENISLCKKVMNDDYYDVSQSKCGAQLAMYFADPTMCEELGILGRYGCYSELAVQLEDHEMCDLITTASKKDDCLNSYIWGNEYYISDWSFCDKFSENSDDQDYCYYSAATSTGSLSYCDKIEGSSIWGNSKADCYASVARMDDDPSVCQSLPSTKEINDCYYSYAISYPYDQDTCNRITDSDKRDNCLWLANESYY